MALREAKEPLCDYGGAVVRLRQKNNGDRLERSCWVNALSGTPVRLADKGTLMVACTGTLM